MNQTYSFLDCTGSIVGPGIAADITQGAAEEGISVEATEDVNTMAIGADGSGMHSLHANKSGRVTVRVLKTSPLNAQLAAAYAFQTATGAAHGKNTIVMANPVTGDSVSCLQCAFAKASPLNFAKDGGMNVWDFHAIRVDRVLGALT